jgi:hypothetical protein
MAKVKLMESRGYNHRRTSAPYAGVVRLRRDPNGSLSSQFDVDFKRGTYVGNYMGGALYVNAEPGDVVMWAQTDRWGRQNFKLFGIIKGPDLYEEMPQKGIVAYLLERERARLGGEPVRTSVPEPAPQKPQEKPAAPPAPPEPEVPPTGLETPVEADPEPEPEEIPES